MLMMTMTIGDKLIHKQHFPGKIVMYSYMLLLGKSMENKKTASDRERERVCITVMFMLPTFLKHKPHLFISFIKHTKTIHL